RAAGRVESVERAQAARHHDRARPAGPRVRRPALRLLPRRQGRRRQPLGAAATGADVLRQLARLGDGGPAGPVGDDPLGQRTPPAGPAARARTRAGRQAMNAFADGASIPLLTLALKASALLGVTALTILLIGRR